MFCSATVYTLYSKLYNNQQMNKLGIKNAYDI